MKNYFKHHRKPRFKDYIHLYWNDTAEDIDRKRRRMAEFLIYEYFPVNCIGLIAVKNEQKKQEVEQIVSQKQQQIPVKVYENWYY